MVLSSMARKTYNIEIQVTGNLERSLKQFKKKLEREGVSRDIKRQVYFEPPTQKKRKRLMRAVKNNMLKMYESMLS
jgi:small subunit ribosomal protein S21